MIITNHKEGRTENTHITILHTPKSFFFFLQYTEYTEYTQKKLKLFSFFFQLKLAMLMAEMVLPVQNNNNVISLTSRRYRTLLTPAIFLIVSSEKKPSI